MNQKRNRRDFTLKEEASRKEGNESREELQYQGLYIVV